MSGPAPSGPPDRTSAPWWREGVIYQVYLRSFADGDGDGVGDLRGLIDRFDHLAGSADSLGVDAIWLSPFYPSGGEDGGYDVTDYCAIDPAYGTLEEFDELVAEAHRRGVRVILDWVPNHTSDRHPWFEQARASRSSPRRDWYVWRDGRDGGPPNNWLSAFDGVGPAWSLDEVSGQWYLHSFSPAQPDLDWDNPEVRRAMGQVLSFWLARGVSGFRIDVAQCLGKDPALGDNPWPITKPTIESAGRRHDEDWDSVFDRLADLRTLVSAGEDEEPMLVGEVYVLDQRRLAQYSAPGRLHLAHDFTLIRQEWSAEGFEQVVGAADSTVGKEGWPAWFLNNHDHGRVATRFAGRGTGRARARAAAVLLLALRGTPFLFQGEELGLADTPIEPEKVVDLDGRDGVRTPLPWASPAEAGPGAGFTAGDPWLPVASEAEHSSVAAQRTDPASTLSLYRRLVALRRQSPALRRGTYEPLAAPEGIFAFAREHGDQRLLVAVNFGTRAVELPADAFAGSFLISSIAERSGWLGPPSLLPDQAVILQPAAQQEASASEASPAEAPSQLVTEAIGATGAWSRTRCRETPRPGPF